MSFYGELFINSDKHRALRFSYVNPNCRLSRQALRIVCFKSFFSKSREKIITPSANANRSAYIHKKNVKGQIYEVYDPIFNPEQINESTTFGERFPVSAEKDGGGGGELGKL